MSAAAAVNPASSYPVPQAPASSTLVQPKDARTVVSFYKKDDCISGSSLMAAMTRIGIRLKMLGNYIINDLTDNPYIDAFLNACKNIGDTITLFLISFIGVLPGLKFGVASGAIFYTLNVFAFTKTIIRKVVDLFNYSSLAKENNDLIKLYDHSRKLIEVAKKAKTNEVSWADLHKGLNHYQLVKLKALLNEKGIDTEQKPAEGDKKLSEPVNVKISIDVLEEVRLRLMATVESRCAKREFTGNPLLENVKAKLESILSSVFDWFNLTTQWWGLFDWSYSPKWVPFVNVIMCGYWAVTWFIKALANIACVSRAYNYLAKNAKTITPEQRRFVELYIRTRVLHSRFKFFVSFVCLAAAFAHGANFAYHLIAPFAMVVCFNGALIPFFAIWFGKLLNSITKEFAQADKEKLVAAADLSKVEESESEKAKEAKDAQEAQESKLSPLEQKEAFKKMLLDIGVDENEVNYLFVKANIYEDSGKDGKDKYKFNQKAAIERLNKILEANANTGFVDFKPMRYPVFSKGTLCALLTICLPFKALRNKLINKMCGLSTPAPTVAPTVAPSSGTKPAEGSQTKSKLEEDASRVGAVPAAAGA